MTSRQLDRVGTAVLLGAEVAIIGLTEDRDLASRAITSAVVWSQTFKVVFSSAKTRERTYHDA